jgi:hypothetical protein
LGREAFALVDTFLAFLPTFFVFFTLEMAISWLLETRRPRLRRSPPPDANKGKR